MEFGKDRGEGGFGEATISFSSIPHIMVIFPDHFLAIYILSFIFLLQFSLTILQFLLDSPSKKRFDEIRSLKQKIPTLSKQKAKISIDRDFVANAKLGRQIVACRKKIRAIEEQSDPFYMTLVYKYGGKLIYWFTFTSTLSIFLWNSTPPFGTVYLKSLGVPSMFGISSFSLTPVVYTVLCHFVISQIFRFFGFIFQSFCLLML